MGSISNSNPSTWSPYDAYKDCSQQICSIYCPQWCYMIFTPPPPPPSDYSPSHLSPLIIALIGILASAFLLITYYALISKYCKRRDDDPQNPNHISDQTAQDQWGVGPGGLDELVIKSITVCKYRKGDGLVEGTECAVCLSEFGEDEDLRLLPNCSHAFHLPCIDAWLKSHSNCPLCRSTAAFSRPPPPQTSSAIDVSPPEIERRDDVVVVVVVDDSEMGHTQEAPPAPAAAASAAGTRGGGGREIVSKGGSERDDVGVGNFRRSMSLGSFSSRRQLLIADILRMGEDEDDEGENRGENSKRNGDCGTDGNGMKRSVSTGRAMFVNKGNISIIPT